MPQPIPSYLLEQAARMAQDWSRGEIPETNLPVDQWSPQAVVHFINHLPDDIEGQRLQMLDQAPGFSTTRNAEIGRSWFVQVARRRHHPAYEAMAGHLQAYGPHPAGRAGVP
jgi:leukotriene-A4 hydrolase